MHKNRLLGKFQSLSQNYTAETINVRTTAEARVGIEKEYAYANNSLQ